MAISDLNLKGNLDAFEHPENGLTREQYQFLQQGFPEKINPRRDLVKIVSNGVLEVKAAYADPEYRDNHFGVIYHPKASVWLHQDLAQVLQRAGEILHAQQGWRLQVLDGLRPMEAQCRMARYVKDNEEELMAVCKAGGLQMGDLISPPGAGAHPRGLAVDVQPIDQEGNKINMGCSFDDFNLRASRSATDFGLSPAENARIVANRKILEAAFDTAAAEFNFPLYKLPSEIWDFRATPEHFKKFAPLSDRDLPKEMSMVEDRSFQNRAANVLGKGWDPKKVPVTPVKQVLSRI